MEGSGAASLSAPRLLLALGLILVADGCRCSRTPIVDKGGAATSGGVLRVAVPAPIAGMDPAFAADLASSEQLANAYEGLLQYHYLRRPYVLVPSLAEAMPEVSADGLTYTFHLRKGVLFQDDPCFTETRGKGRELVAEDFVYSFKRLADPKVGAAAAWVIEGKLAGLDDWRREAAKATATDYARPLEGVRAIDRYTLRFKLARRTTQFPYLLAMPAAFVVPREAVETYRAQFALHPVGTGPYRLSEFDPARRWVWSRNPTYRADAYPGEGEPADREAGFLADAGKPLPLNERIQVSVVSDARSLWQTFLAGQLELSPLPVGKEQLERTIAPNKELVAELSARGIRLHKHVAPEITHLAFNMDHLLIGSNRALRQALSLAYDSTGFVELFHGGFALPAQSPIPPGIAGHDDAFRNPFRQTNPARAKELLGRAGFPDGRGLPQIRIAMAGTGDRTDAARIPELVHRAFGDIGIDAVALVLAWPEFWASVKGRQAEIFLSSWTADYPDAQDFLQLFYGPNRTPGPNESNYANAEYDRLYERAVELSDGAERAALYRRMIAIVTEDCPWIAGEYRIAATVTQPWLRNYKPNDFDRAAWKYLRVDTPSKIQ